MNGAAGTDPADEGLAALLEAARSMWPGALVAVADGAGGSGTSFDEEYALVPSARRARLLVPLRPRAAVPAALCRFSSASSNRDVLTRLAVAAASRAAGSQVLRDRVFVRASPASIAMGDHLSGVLERPVTFALGVGPARVNRKPVLQVLDGRGRTVAFAKIGDSAQARADVNAEAVALRRLGEHRFTSFVVPEVLDVSRWNGMTVLVMSALRVRPSLRSRPPAVPQTAMHELATAFGEEQRALDALPWWRRQGEIVAGLQDEDLRARLGRCWDVLAERHGGTTVDVGAWHGDWTPWNTGRSGASVLVWDWERFESGTPVGLDACHYTAQAAVRTHGLDPAVVLSALADTRGPSPYADLLADVYLLAISLRYAALLGAERGADVAVAARTMTRALEGRVSPRTTALKAGPEPGSARRAG